MSRLEKKKQLSMRHDSILAIHFYHKHSAIRPVHGSPNSAAILDPITIAINSFLADI